MAAERSKHAAARQCAVRRLNYLQKRESSSLQSGGVETSDNIVRRPVWCLRIEVHNRV